MFEWQLKETLPCCGSVHCEDRKRRTAYPASTYPPLALSVDQHHPYFSSTSTSGTPTDPDGGFTCSRAASVAAMS